MENTSADRGFIPSPLKSIRKHCIRCAGGRYVEVRKCQDLTCFLHSYRFGRNPNRSGIGPGKKGGRHG